MWFEVVLVDKLSTDGTLASTHIRSSEGETFPIDRLEDIDPTFKDLADTDIGPLRVYGHHRVRSTILRSKPRNFSISPGCLLLQFEHIRVPLHAGYYALVLPAGWRAAELHIYDPYDQAEDPRDKRSFREIDISWDARREVSCAQFQMRSGKHGAFSMGVIARLALPLANEDWPGREAPAEILLTDQRNHNDPIEAAYREETERALNRNATRQEMPGVDIGLNGPSIDIVEWGRYLRQRIWRP